MAKSQSFTPEAVQQLERLERLLTQPVLRTADLVRWLTPCPAAHVWAELVSRIQRQEEEKLKAKSPRVDLQRALVRGRAWKTSDGVLDHTWTGAKDGKIAPRRALPILLRVDLPTGQLLPHPRLMQAVQLLLDASLPGGAETEKERFVQRLEYWERLASANIESRKGQAKLQTLLEDIDTQADAAQKIQAYEKAKAWFIATETAAAPRRKNDAAHALATELWLLCQDFRQDIDDPGVDPDAGFQRLNRVVNAVRLADRLQRVASLGNAVRSLKMLEKKGRNAEPFAEAVREACDRCWRAEPGRRPSPKAVLEALQGRIVQQDQQDFVAPLKSVEASWRPVPVKSLYNAIAKWAKAKGLKVSGSRRPKKSEQLPKPEPL